MDPIIKSKVLEQLSGEMTSDWTALSQEQVWVYAARWIDKFAFVEKTWACKEIRFELDDVLGMFLDRPTVPFVRGERAVNRFHAHTNSTELVILSPSLNGVGYLCKDAVPAALEIPTATDLFEERHGLSIPVVPIFADTQYTWTFVLILAHRGPFFTTGVDRD